MSLAHRLQRAALAVLTLFAGLAQAQDAPAEPALRASASLTLELRNAQWFDGEKFQRGTLYVAEGRFTAQKPKRIHRRLELRAQYLVPPLAEAHNHNLQNPWGVEHFAQRYLRNGVFYAQMQCGDPSGVDPVRGQLNGPDSPDVSFVTACITSSDGHPLAALLAAPAAEGQPAPTPADVADRAVLLMDSVADVEAKWPLIKGRQTDLIKLILSYHEREELRGRADTQGRLGLRAEVAQAIVRRAHAEGLRVIAQADSAADFAVAVQAGVDQIAHVPGYFNHHGDGAERFSIAEEALAQAARQKTAVVTGTAATALFQTTPEQLAMLRLAQTDNLRRLRAAGVPLLLGSDSFMGDAQDELRSLASLEVFSSAELIKLATMDTAHALFPKRQLGCFKPGCEASFLVLGANPLNDLSQLARPMLRVKQGRILTPLSDVALASDSLSENTDTPALRSSKKSKAGIKSSAKSGTARTGKAATSKRPAAKTTGPARTVKQASTRRH